MVEHHCEKDKLSVLELQNDENHFYLCICVKDSYIIM